MRKEEVIGRINCKSESEVKKYHNNSDPLSVPSGPGNEVQNRLESDKTVCHSLPTRIHFGSLKPDQDMRKVNGWPNGVFLTEIHYNGGVLGNQTKPINTFKERNIKKIYCTMVSQEIHR